MINTTRDILECKRLYYWGNYYVKCKNTPASDVSCHTTIALLLSVDLILVVLIKVRTSQRLCSDQTHLVCFLHNLSASPIVKHRDVQWGMPGES